MCTDKCLHSRLGRLLKGTLVKLVDVRMSSVSLVSRPNTNSSPWLQQDTSAGGACRNHTRHLDLIQKVAHVAWGRAVLSFCTLQACEESLRRELLEARVAPLRLAAQQAARAMSQSAEASFRHAALPVHMLASTLLLCATGSPCVTFDAVTRAQQGTASLNHEPATPSSGRCC